MILLSVIQLSGGHCTLFSLSSEVCIIWNFFFYFRSEKYLRILRSALLLALQNDENDSAKLIYEKFGEDKKEISNDPYCKIYFQRYFDISRHLDNNTNIRNAKEKRQRERQMKNKGIYNSFICQLIQNRENTTAARAIIDLNSDEDDDFECPVCFEFMFEPRKIYACHRGHNICSVCIADPRIRSCPICRDDFEIRRPQRSIEAEKKAKIFQEK
jgi:hypothetical protein